MTSLLKLLLEPKNLFYELQARRHKVRTLSQMDRGKDTRPNKNRILRLFRQQRFSASSQTYCDIDSMILFPGWILVIRLVGLVDEANTLDFNINLSSCQNEKNSTEMQKMEGIIVLLGIKLQLNSQLNSNSPLLLETLTHGHCSTCQEKFASHMLS